MRQLQPLQLQLQQPLPPPPPLLRLPLTGRRRSRPRPSLLLDHAPQATPQAVDVKLEDQQKINAFSRLNTRLHELEAQLAAKKARRCRARLVGLPEKRPRLRRRVQMHAST